MLKRLTVAGAALVVLAVMVGGASPAPSHRRSPDAVAHLRDVDGSRIGIVKLWRAPSGKVVVAASLHGIEPAGEFHGFHIHATGICDPEAVDPATGAVAPFVTAGGHFNPGDTAHGEHAGDLPVLLVDAEGSARSRVVTDRFALADLFDHDRSAVIVHAGRDNYSNIPATASTGGERYHSHLEDVFGPDSITLATGDAGSRFGCGVVRRG